VLPGLVQIVLFVIVLFGVTRPLGAYLQRVFNGEWTPLARVLRPVEQWIYRFTGVDPATEQEWTAYTASLLVFGCVGALILYAIERFQAVLPLNPQVLGGVAPDLAFNTAVSFVTNTNWQSYTPETTMSYFTQAVGLAVHNFVSAATGMAIAVALTRALARDSATTIGNFWVDLVRGTLYVLLPISIVFGLIFVWQGVPQNLNPYVVATSVEGANQTIAQGPAASQEIIKLLGTNGGGFFNANSAHPYENPTPLTNFLEMLALLAVPAGIVNMFGRMVGDVRQGWVIWAAMAILLVAGIAVALPQEQAGNPAFANLNVDQQISATQVGGNFEGKESRFGIASSVLFTVVTTDAGGAFNANLDSLMPLAGLVAMLNMQIGEIAFGGIGSGLYGMLVFVLLTLFIAGLMVGRTPEYLGKKIQAPLGNPGPHGFSEIVYAYTSTTANNGTAFSGLGFNTLFYNVTLSLAMLIGRYLVAVPVLAIAGSMVTKPRLPAGLGTLPTEHPVFVGLLVGTIVVVGILTYFPAVSLGPIVEQYLVRRF
jgi:K+-transporting ATPase ATPase A chain